MAREKRYKDMAAQELKLAGAQLWSAPSGDTTRAYTVVLDSIARLHAAFHSTSAARAEDFLDDVELLLEALRDKLEEA